MLKGYFTFIMAFVAVAVGVLCLIFSWAGTLESLLMIWGGFTAAGIRRGINGSNKPVVHGIGITPPTV
jgi:hypothetical protein